MPGASCRSADESGHCKQVARLGAGSGDRVSQRVGGEQVDVASKIVKAEIVENPGARSRAQGGGAGVAKKGNRCTVQ